MLIAFNLTMPNAASWNGKWSGEGRCYARVRTVSAEKGLEILKNKDYDYRWNDGWCANVEVSKIDAKEAAKIRKKSVGFSGYDWMIDSIIERQKILNSVGR